MVQHVNNIVIEDDHNYMLYFKNKELADKYHISLGTVRNWIEAAQNGKLSLVLHTANGKSYVANTVNNILTIESLIEGRKKYRPHRAHKIIAPRPEFYNLYNKAQIYDIITSLEVSREIPRQYNYFDGGAAHWDEYIHRMEREELSSNLVMTRRLLNENEKYIDALLAEYHKINVIDIGVGNAMPVKELLTRLLSQNKLEKYVAIDISPEMLRIAKRNIQEWFGDKIAFETQQLDITRDRLVDILAPDYIKNAASQVGNLLLFLGGTLQNFRKRDVPLQVINDSMGVNDLFIHTQKLDSEGTRHHFDFSSQPGIQTLPPIHGLVIDILNIPPSLYDLELGYDELKRERYEKIRFKISVSLKFDFKEGVHVVSIEKGEAILLWRASQESALELLHQFDRNDFYVLQSSQTPDEEYIMTISRVKRH